MTLTHIASAPSDHPPVASSTIQSSTEKGEKMNHGLPSWREGRGTRIFRPGTTTACHSRVSQKRVTDVWVTGAVRGTGCGASGSSGLWHVKSVTAGSVSQTRVTTPCHSLTQQRVTTPCHSRQRVTAACHSRQRVTTPCHSGSEGQGLERSVGCISAHPHAPVRHPSPPWPSPTGHSSVSQAAGSQSGVVGVWGTRILRSDYHSVCEDRHSPRHEAP